MENNIVTFEAEKIKLNSGLFKDFVVCTAYLMSDGVNRNYSEFTLESLQKSLPSFENKPVLANIWFQKSKNGGKKAYVGSHDWNVERDEDGEEYISYRNGETPVGVITDKSQISIQKYKGRNFVVAKLFLWKQYNYELIKILARDKKKKVSVEVVFTDWDTYTDENGREIKKVNAFDFLGVTILGHQKKMFGEPEPVEEGIENSHLELEEGQLENYAMSFAKALESSIKDNRQEYDNIIKSDKGNHFLSNEYKREVVLQELNDIYFGEISIISFYSPENSLDFSAQFAYIYREKEGQGGELVREEGEVYKPVLRVRAIRGHVNIDGSCDIIEDKEIEGKEKEKILSTQVKYLESIKMDRDLIINEVNLVDDAELNDVGQLIYTLFTYQNSNDIVNLLFGMVEEGWQNNPYEKLGFPIACLGQYSITFSERALREDMDLDALQKLYQKIEFMTGFSRVRDIVKSIIEEKYEMGETSNVEKENEAVNAPAENVADENELKDEQQPEENGCVDVNEENKDKIDENDCDGNGAEPEENGCDEPKEHSEGPEENGCDEPKENCGPEQSACGEPEEHSEGEEEGCDGSNPAENAEEGKDGEEPQENAADDDKDDADDKDDDDKDDGEEDFAKFNEELSQKYEVAVNQIAEYTATIGNLTKEVESSNSQLQTLSKELEAAKEEINSLKLAAFVRDIEAELAQSALDKENKEKILNMAKEQKFENIIDAQKEIAFIEKQTKTNSYTFASSVVNTSFKPEVKKDVFDKLKAKNKW